MKYFSSQTVANAYKNFQNCMTNKSWGYLALLKECGEFVKPSTTFPINLNEVSNFLEELFNLNDTKKTYEGGKYLYVVFSNKWKDYFKAQGNHAPNIYDVAVWAFRRVGFEDIIDLEKLFSLFATSFNIPTDVLRSCFDTSKRELLFVDNLYSEAQLKLKLHEKGVDTSKNNIDAQCKSVVANPGEISRGPFIQPLYAGLDVTDYVLILQSDYAEIYGSSLNVNSALSCSRYSIKQIANSTKSYFAAIRTKPFLLLAGISGTGKSRIVRELAFKSCPSYLQDKDGTTPGNYCMIEVKPNWHDSSELLGYYSNISKKYIFTKFVKFLVRAMMHPNVPFFVCLDEMNLAPVEQYFAEFLSVLETRKLVGNNVVSGTLVSNEYFKAIEQNNNPSDKDWYNYFFDIKETGKEPQDSLKLVEDAAPYGVKYTLKEKGLKLPQNVFIIGTVNMDDTTHQFSRKVIDRAMTIEMNGEELEKMFGGSADLTYVDNDDELITMEHIGAKYVSADDVLKNCERVKNNAEAIIFITGIDSNGNIVDDNADEDTLPKRLRQINDVLKNTPFQVSYRVLNELVIYLAVLLDEDKENKSIEDLANVALDNIMLMKILPRIEGDYEMFNQNGEENKLVRLQKLFAGETQSNKKLDEMIKRLDSTEFTRFWP